MKIAVWWEQELWGGVDSHLSTLLKNWPDKSDQFFIFYNSGNQGLRRIIVFLERMENVVLVAFPEPSKLPGLFGKVLRYFFFPFRLYALKLKSSRILRKYGPFDVLFADNGAYPGAWGCLSALWAAASIGIKVRLLLIHHAANARRPFRQNTEALLDIFVQKWTTDLVSVSHATRHTLIERRNINTEICPIRVIHNGIDPQIEESAVEVKSLREQLNIPKDAFVIGMVGRLERYKGHEDLILALGRLPPDQRANTIAIFVGGGTDTERRRLESIAGKVRVEAQVRFVGYVEGNSSILMKQFDLLAMLTKDFEGFGLTIGEAMCVGTPVLATNVGAVPEFVSDEVAILVRPEAPDEVADALLMAMNDREQLRLRAVKAIKHIEKYTGSVMARKFHQLLIMSEAV